jgi:hypothetical protein
LDSLGSWVELYISFKAKGELYDKCTADWKSRAGETWVRQNLAKGDSTLSLQATHPKFIREVLTQILLLLIGLIDLADHISASHLHLRLKMSHIRDLTVGLRSASTRMKLLAGMTTHNFSI